MSYFCTVKFCADAIAGIASAATNASAGVMRETVRTISASMLGVVEFQSYANTTGNGGLLDSFRGDGFVGIGCRYVVQGSSLRGSLQGVYGQNPTMREQPRAHDKKPHTLNHLPSTTDQPQS